MSVLGWSRYERVRVGEVLYLLSRACSDVAAYSIVWKRREGRREGRGLPVGRASEKNAEKARQTSHPTPLLSMAGTNATFGKRPRLRHPPGQSIYILGILGGSPRLAFV